MNTLEWICVCGMIVSTFLLWFIQHVSLVATKVEADVKKIKSVLETILTKSTENKTKETVEVVNSDDIIQEK
jgi:uncharacterized membrane protein